MTKDAPELITLADREPVPIGSVTFGQLIRESVERFDTQRSVAKAERHHLDLYDRWVRRYRAALAIDDPIFTDIRHWEWYVCRFVTENDATCRPWFFDRLTPMQRRELCRQSREIRKIRA